MLINELMVPAVLGSMVGAALGLTGAGGGVLAVPLLVFVLHLDLPAAAPLALLSVAASASVGSWFGWREGVLRYRAAAWMGGAGLLCAPLGVRVAHALPPAPLALVFAAVLLWTARRMWTAPARPAELHGDGAGPSCRIQGPGPRLRWTPGCAGALAATGAAAGFLSGLLGVGGGFAIVPALTRVTNLDARSVATTSMATIALVALGGLVGGFSAQPVQASLAWGFGGASVLSLLVVRRWSHGVSPLWVRRGFSVMCLLAAAMLVQRSWT